MAARGGLKHVYFVGCGGSKAAIFPGLYLLQSEAKNFSATTYTSNEFVHATPAQLDERCLAVICSLKATPETVKAVETANAAGAITIAMTGSMETGMAKVGPVCGDLFQRGGSGVQQLQPGQRPEDWI